MYDKVAWLAVVIAFFSVLMGTINKLFVKIIATQQIVSWFHVANTFILFGIFFLVLHYVRSKE